MVIYADDHILVINKPPGLRSIQDGYDATLPHVASILSPDWGRLFIVHRLDKDTSGVLLLARTEDSHRILDRQFAQRRVTKVYLAVCLGCPDWVEKLIDLPLRVNGDRKHRTVVDTIRGKPAQTDVRMIRSTGALSFIEARPHTGYTHQIRAHLSALGFPLLGDPLYKYPRDYKGVRIPEDTLPAFSRTALHAWQLQFLHPVGGESLVFVAPYPEDFPHFLETLDTQ